MVFTLSVRAVTGDGVSGALRATGEATPNDDPLCACWNGPSTRRPRSEPKSAGCAGRSRPAREPPDLTEVTAVLERIEVVQARLDGVAAVTDMPDDPAVGPGLRVAVGIALAMSTLALVLGLWSVFG